MTKIYNLPEIQAVLPEIDVVSAMASAFAAYSRGQAVVPPVGELLFSDPPGDVHIKYGYLKGDEWFVIKIASGFYQNPDRGLPANSGMMLMFETRTGLPIGILLEQGHLTNVRTAAAGALSAKLLAPQNVERIGICGSGIQARMQVELLKHITSCRRLTVYARDERKTRAYAEEMSAKGFSVKIAPSPASLAAECNLIVTATAAQKPFLLPEDVQAGTHITAVGSDTPEKNELAPEVLAKAHLVVADSISQCKERGEVHHAVVAGVLDVNAVVELGTLVTDPATARRDSDWTTVCDLTGVAVQDIAICKAVLMRLSDRKEQEAQDGN